MQIDIIAPGRVKERYLRDAIDEYSKRLSRYCKLNIIEVADEKTPDHASEGVDRQIKAREGERIAKHLKDGAFVIALAINEKSCTRITEPSIIDAHFENSYALVVCKYRLAVGIIILVASAVQSALTTRFCVVLIFC